MDLGTNMDIHIGMIQIYMHIQIQTYIRTKECKITFTRYIQERLEVIGSIGLVHISSIINLTSIIYHNCKTY
jgi:hypothetical protein